MRNFKILNLTLLGTLGFSTNVLGSSYGGYDSNSTLSAAQADVAQQQAELAAAQMKLEQIRRSSRDDLSVRARPAPRPVARPKYYDDTSMPDIAPARGSFDKSPLPAWRGPARVSAPAMPMLDDTDPDLDVNVAQNRWDASSLYSSYDPFGDSDATDPDAIVDDRAAQGMSSLAPQRMTRDAAATRIQSAYRGSARKTPMASAASCPTTATGALEEQTGMSGMDQSRAQGRAKPGPRRDSAMAPRGYGRNPASIVDAARSEMDLSRPVGEYNPDA